MSECNYVTLYQLHLLCRLLTHLVVTWGFVVLLLTFCESGLVAITGEPACSWCNQARDLASSISVWHRSTGSQSHCVSARPVWHTLGIHTDTHTRKHARCTNTLKENATLSGSHREHGSVLYGGDAGTLPVASFLFKPYPSASVFECCVVVLQALHRCLDCFSACRICLPAACFLALLPFPQIITGGQHLPGHAPSTNCGCYPAALPCLHIYTRQTDRHTHTRCIPPSVRFTIDWVEVRLSWLLTVDSFVISGIGSTRRVVTCSDRSSNSENILCWIQWDETKALDVWGEGSRLATDGGEPAVLISDAWSARVAENRLGNRRGPVKQRQEKVDLEEKQAGRWQRSESAVIYS